MLGVEAEAEAEESREGERGLTRREEGLPSTIKVLDPIESRALLGVEAGRDC